MSNVQLIEVKASGRFGTVWQGKMSVRDVAVKIFQSQEKESWKAENEIYNVSCYLNFDWHIFFCKLNRFNESVGSFYPEIRWCIRFRVIKINYI